MILTVTGMILTVTGIETIEVSDPAGVSIVVGLGLRPVPGPPRGPTISPPPIPTPIRPHNPNPFKPWGVRSKEWTTPGDSKWTKGMRTLPSGYRS